MVKGGKGKSVEGGFKETGRLKTASDCRIKDSGKEFRRASFRVWIVSHGRVQHPLFHFLPDGM